MPVVASAANNPPVIWSASCTSGIYNLAKQTCLVSGGGTGSPGGPNTSIQFNDSGSFNGDSNLVWDNTNKELGLFTVPSHPFHVYKNSTIGDTDAITGVINYDGDSSHYPPTGSTHAIQVYAYKFVDGVRVFHFGFTSDDVTDNSSDFYSINWSWDPVPGADGYIVYKSSTDCNQDFGPNWAYENVVGTTSIVDHGCTDWTSGFIPVNPNSWGPDFYINDLGREVFNRPALFNSTDLAFGAYAPISILSNSDISEQQDGTLFSFFADVERHFGGTAFRLQYTFQGNEIGFDCGPNGCLGSVVGSNISFTMPGNITSHQTIGGFDNGNTIQSGAAREVIDFNFNQFGNAGVLADQFSLITIFATGVDIKANGINVLGAGPNQFVLTDQSGNNAIDVYHRELLTGSDQVAMDWTTAAPTFPNGIGMGTEVFTRIPEGHFSYDSGTLSSTSFSNTIKKIFMNNHAVSMALITASATTLTSCTTNPKIALYLCDTANCSTFTEMGNVTLTSTGTGTSGTFTVTDVPASSWIAWAFDQGTCSSLNVNADAVYLMK